MTVTPADAVLLLLLVTFAAAAFSRRFRTPSPVILAIAGVAVGIAWRFMPFMPQLEFPPRLVLMVFLPPLLLKAAYALPLGAFRANIRSILGLAVGLVLATMFVTAFTARLVMPTLPWVAALALGAIIAPPDPVAASAVALRTGLSHRLATILEGEGLVNDALAIVAYQLVVQAAVSGNVTWMDTALAVVREAPAGVAIGLVFGWIAVQIRRRLDDSSLEIGISLLLPFVTYQLADRLGGSAVLAVVTLGFVLRRHDVEISSPATRLTTRAVWGAVDFVGTTLVFMLIGLQIGAATAAPVTSAFLRASALVAASVVGLRLAWMLCVPHITLALRFHTAERVPSWRELTVLGWAGMRGVVSLALALALPLTTESGQPFPARTTIILLSFAVIMATLILQGLTLVPLTRLLHVGDAMAEPRAEQRVRGRARRAAHAAIMRVARTDRLPAGECQRLAEVIGTGEFGIAAGGTSESRAVLEQALDVQRSIVSRARDAGRIGDPLAQRLEAELDRDLVRLRGEEGNGPRRKHATD